MKSNHGYWFIRYCHNFGSKEIDYSILEVVHSSYFYDQYSNRPLFNVKFKTKKEATQMLRKIKKLLKRWEQ